MEREALLDSTGRARAFGELRNVADVERAIGRKVPEDMSAELATDKAWFPNERRPPFLDFAESFVATASLAPGEAKPLDPQQSGDSGGGVIREGLRPPTGRTRPARAGPGSSGEAAQLAVRGYADGRPGRPRWSLPAGHVADFLRAMRRVTGDDLTKVAQVFGLDPSSALGVLSGEIEEVDIPHIQQVCEGVHCSPYDLWGKEDPQTILHAYGPGCGRG